MHHDPELHRRFQALTAKQREALTLLREARTTKEIARELGISPSAVEFRLKAVRDKIGVANRRELVRLHSRLPEVMCIEEMTRSANGPDMYSLWRRPTPPSLVKSLQLVLTFVSGVASGVFAVELIDLLNQVPRQ